MIFFQLTDQIAKAEIPGIDHNRTTNTIMITVPNKNLALVIDYATGCIIKELRISNENTLSKLGVFTGIRIGNEQYTSQKTRVRPQIREDSKSLILQGITYGDSANQVTETWTFQLRNDKISWSISRVYAKPVFLEETLSLIHI